MYLLEHAEHYNLPLGIVINKCVATRKARSVPVIMINSTKLITCIWQPLLAAELFTPECHQAENRANMERKGDNIDIPFLPVAPNTFRVQLEQ